MTLAIALIVAPQLIGGVYAWGVAIITTMAGVACVAAAWAAREDDNRSPLGAVGLTAGLVLAWTAIQALPLPRTLTEWVQPEAVVLADGGARLLREPVPGWIALSLAPGSTMLQFVLGAGLIAAFLAASTLVALGHRRRVLVGVAVSGLVMAVVAVLHTAVGAERVFGIYQPIHTTNPLLAPLVNQNQLSGFLSMCAPVLVGLGMDRDEPRARWGWLAAGTLVATCALVAVSRGGAASTVVGFLTLGLFALFRRRRAQGHPVGTSVVLIAAVLATAVGLGLYVAADALYRDFEQGSLVKLTLAQMGAELALDHPFVGVGRGAFSAAFVSRLGTTTRITHPENLIALWASEWGIAIAVALVAILGWAILRAARTAKSWAHLGGAAGLVALFAHDLVDHSLELAGVSVVAAALAGGVVTASRRQRVAAARVTLPRAAAGAGALALGLVLVAGWTLDQRSVLGLQRTLEAQLRQGDRESFRRTVIEAVRAHPSEPAFALLGGSEAAQRGDAEALRWLNRAMALAPGWGAPHEEAARYLVRAGFLRQALLEIREAGVRGRIAAAETACDALARHPEYAPVAIATLRADEVGDQLLDSLGACLPRAPAGVAIDTHLVARGVLGARMRSARRALAEGRPGDALALLPEADGDDPRVIALRARAHLAAGAAARAIEVLDRVEPSAPLLEIRARAECASRDEAAMLATLERLRGLASGSSTGVARVWLLEGELQEQLGNDFAALRAFGRAERMDPRSEGLARAAPVAERVGDLGRSYRAYADLCQRGGARSPHCRSRDRLRAALDESRHPVEQPLGTP